MSLKIPDTVKHLFTYKREFEKNGKKIIKDFVPVIQKVTEEEILFIYELIAKKYSESFTIDLIKNVPEENLIYFRGSFDIDLTDKNKKGPKHMSGDVKYKGKGTIYLDSESYDIIFDNLDRILHKKVEEKILKLINK